MRGGLAQKNNRGHRAGTRNAKKQYRGTYNLLRTLACAQSCGLDFTGVTWVDVEGHLGQGGQAIVSQIFANLEAVLAFKRPKTDGIGSRFSRGLTNQKVILKDAYREQASEILTCACLAGSGFRKGVIWRFVPVYGARRLGSGS